MRLASLLLAALVVTSVSAQPVAGALEASDPTFNNGELYDDYTIQAADGATVEVTVESSDFDTYVMLRQGDGAWEENDDCVADDTSRSCLTVVADGDGAMTVRVTSFDVGETGAYTLHVDGALFGDAPETGRGRNPGAAPELAATLTGRTGELDASDATLRSGEYVETHTVELRVGQRLTVTMASSEFDPYLIVKAPSGEQEDNDDANGSLDAEVRLDALESGTFEILATSAVPGETGAYRVDIAVGDAPVASGEAFVTGELASGDDTFNDGEYVDRIPFQPTAASTTVDLRSSEMDTYLIVRTPSGEQFDNDDYRDSRERSLLVVDTSEPGEYTAVVTSYAVGETGRYDLSIRPTGSDAAPLAAGLRQEAGALADGDETLRSGEYVDTYTFTGTPGQRIQIDLTSEDFDTYLVLSPPDGEAIQDDDGGGRTGHSRIQADLTEAGTYTVFATSYAAAETGAYALSFDFTERFGGEAPDGDATDARPTNTTWQPVERRIGDWTIAEDIAGELDASDPRLGSGEFTEVHTFDGDAGEPVRVALASSSFDTYLMVHTPSGVQLENDDHDGRTDLSVVEFVMPEDGRYRITATSYRAGATGDYTLRLSQADAMRAEPPAYDRIAGVFMGISDYAPAGDFPGEGDLAYTAEDASLVRDAMLSVGMRAEDGILLTDADATAGRFESAVRDLAARTDENTLFVLFYSGHGSQQPRADGYQREDPDALDETLALYDRAVTDDELDRILSMLPAGRQLIVVDACYSGGLSKDIISRPGRMGLFSSEEDILSQVAFKFEAGGYLSRFFADGVAGRQADEDGNGAISALELSHYIYERYRGDVRNTGREIIQARETRPAHQKLVVDRGSLGLYETLFNVGG